MDLKIKEYCKKEIKWASDCLKELYDPDTKHYYTPDDEVFLMARKESFEEMLEEISNTQKGE